MSAAVLSWRNDVLRPKP